ncbi:MAG: hypothetical protein ACYSUK_02475 [Planctomycetota bacterium]|jgi:hypothetical protein
MIKKNFNRGGLLFILGLLIVTQLSVAASSSTKQGVTIKVPQIRAVYLDQQDKIIAVFSNVSDISEHNLQAFKGGVQIAVDEEILRQYRILLPRIDVSKIGWIYLQID